MKQENINRIVDAGVVAVVRKVEEEKVQNVIEALVRGGIKGIEMTMDSSNVLNSIKTAKNNFGKDAVIGAGTVLDGETANRAIDAGAEFIFAPTLDEGTIRTANKYGKIVIPGVFTPTEILQAYEWGADIVKVFPASVLGPKFIKDVRGPLGHIPMMPTGGVSLDNTAEYIRAGSAAVGVGGSLLDKQLIENNEWGKIEELARKFVEQVQIGRDS